MVKILSYWDEWGKIDTNSTNFFTVKICIQNMNGKSFSVLGCKSFSGKKLAKNTKSICRRFLIGINFATIFFVIRKFHFSRGLNSRNFPNQDLFFVIQTYCRPLFPLISQILREFGDCVQGTDSTRKTTGLFATFLPLFGHCSSELEQILVNETKVYYGCMDMDVLIPWRSYSRERHAFYGWI